MSGEREPCVFVVDDDEQVRDALTELLHSVWLEVRAFSTATEFLESFSPDQPGCLLVDVRLPGMSGLDLQATLNRRGVVTPIIFVSAYGDIPSAVRAVRNGALDFIQKPFREESLLACIHQAIEVDRRRRSEEAVHRQIDARLERLTPRELEVLDHIVHGNASRATAEALGISIRTVEIHRSRVFRKLGTDQISEVVRMVMASGRYQYDEE